MVSYHSLEDRIVKTFFKERSGYMSHSSRYLPDAPRTRATFQLESRKAILPQEDEISSNPRARSARLRWGIRREGEA